MTNVDICLILITVFSSTCFGYCAGKNAGYKEGMNVVSKLFKSFLKFEVPDEDKKEE